MTVITVAIALQNTFSIFPVTYYCLLPKSAPHFQLRVNSEKVISKTGNLLSRVAGFWKGNHILIEFPPMVANARVRLQSIFLLQKPLITNTLAEYPNFDTMRLRMHPLLLRVCAFAVLGGST